MDEHDGSAVAGSRVLQATAVSARKKQRVAGIGLNHFLFF
jgi:hypothetical protein